MWFIFAYGDIFAFLSQVKTKYAVTIQQWWRSVWKAKQRKKYTAAAIVLQAHWRRKRAQILLQRLREQKEWERKVSSVLLFGV